MCTVLLSVNAQHNFRDLKAIATLLGPTQSQCYGLTKQTKLKIEKKSQQKPKVLITRSDAKYSAAADVRPMHALLSALSTLLIHSQSVMSKCYVIT